MMDRLRTNTAQLDMIRQVELVGHAMKAADINCTQMIADLEGLAFEAS